MEAEVAESHWSSLYGADGRNRSPELVDVAWDPAGPRVAWQRSVGTGYSSPVIADGKLVFHHKSEGNEWTECHDLEEGDLLWRQSSPATATCIHEYSDGPYSTPVIDAESNRVFRVGGDGQFDCFDFKTGSRIWQRNYHQEMKVPNEDFPVGTSPRLDIRSDGKKQLIYNLGAFDQDAGVVSIDPEDGTLNWRSSDEEIGYCVPIVAEMHGQRFAFVYTKHNLLCLNPNDGKVDWRYEHFSRAPMSYNAVSPLVVENSVVVVSAGPGALCLDVLPDRSYRERWKNRRVVDAQYNGLMAHDGYLYSFTTAGQGGAEFRCVNLDDGSLMWKFHSHLNRGQGLIAGDSILLVGEHGHLASLECNSEGPRVFAFTKEPLMQTPCYSPPALSKGRLAVKDEHRLVVFDLRK